MGRGGDVDRTPVAILARGGRRCTSSAAAGRYAVAWAEDRFDRERLPASQGDSATAMQHANGFVEDTIPLCCLTKRSGVSYFEMTSESRTDE